MNQKSRPVSDLSTGSWTPTPIYPQVNGSLSGGEVASNPSVEGDTFQVKLAGLAWPQHWRDEPPGQVLTVNLTKTEADSLPTTISLDQGDQVIKHVTIEPAGSAQLVLTRADVEQITDYSDLSVTVTAGKPHPACCPSPVDAVLVATFHHMTCPTLEGVEVTLRYRGLGVAGVVWTGENSNVCGLRLTVELTCLGSGIGGFSCTFHWFDNISCTVPFTGSALVDSTCDPFRLHFAFSSIPVGGSCPCCTNTIMSGELDITSAT